MELSEIHNLNETFFIFAEYLNGYKENYFW
jgi:hypothetical protein